MKASTIRKRALVTIVIILSIILLLVASSSVLAKYLIEKNDEKLIGRRIAVSWVIVNPITGYAYVRNLKVYELHSNSVFFAADGLSINISLLKILRKTYEVSEITLYKPTIFLIQSKDELNIRDILQHFSKDTTKKDTNSHQKINILGIKIIGGEFHYIEKNIPINYFIKNLHFESPGKWADKDTMHFKFSFFSGISTGEVNAEGTVNLKTLEYHSMHLQVKDLDLVIIQQYMKELSNFGHFSAVFNADMRANGNFADRGKTNSTGLISLSNFHLGKAPGDDYVSFEKFGLCIHKLNPNGYVYHYDSVTLIHPVITYERYDYLDNFQRMFGKGAANVKTVNAERKSRFNLIIEVAHFIRDIAANFSKSNYRIGKLAIYDGNLRFNDFSKSEKFSIAAYALNIMADSIDRKKHNLSVLARAGIRPYGEFRVRLYANPRDTGEYHIDYHLNHIPLAMFNPYTIACTSYPLDKGTLQLNGHWTMKSNKVNGSNHLVLLDPHLSQRLKRKDINKMPVPLILAFLKERGNAIDYEIPVTGSLQNPSINMGKIAFQLIGNIFTTPVSIPYNMHVNHAESEIDKFQSVKWLPGQVIMSNNQEKFLKNLNNFLEKTPEASFLVQPIQYESKEKEYMLYYEAKKRYYLSTHSMDNKSYEEKDSLEVEKMSVKNVLFVRAMNKHIKDTALMFTTQEKCAAYLGKLTSPNSQDLIREGKKVIDTKFHRLIRQRELLFLSFFKNDEVRKRISFMKDSFLVPYNGFSYYQINYKGDIPDKLKKAYSKLTDW